MKEIYNAPVLQVISFVPDAKLASFDFDDIQDGIFNDGSMNDPSGTIDTNGL